MYDLISTLKLLVYILISAQVRRTRIFCLNSSGYGEEEAWHNVQHLHLLKLTPVLNATSGSKGSC